MVWWVGRRRDGRTDGLRFWPPPSFPLADCLSCVWGGVRRPRPPPFPFFSPLPSAPPPFDSSSRSRISSSLSPLIPLLLLRRRRPSKQGGHVERGEETKKKASSLSSSSSPWGTTSGYIPCRPLPLSRVPDLRGEGGKGKEPTFLSLSFFPAGRPSVRCPNQGERSPPPSPSPQPANNAVECERKAARGVESTSTEGLSLSRMPLPPLPSPPPITFHAHSANERRGRTCFAPVPSFPFPNTIRSFASLQRRRERLLITGGGKRRRAKKGGGGGGGFLREREEKLESPARAGRKREGRRYTHPPHIACYACLPVQYVVFMLPPSSNVMRRWRRASLLA